jgi:glutamate-ammonia-ligase adenylyltransferase
MEALRLFKQVNVLRVAAADLTGVMALMVVSDKLTEIAEVIVAKTLALSWQSVCAAYGTPAGATSEVVSGFGVVGFGKLGGIELGFSSDLDLVFIHQDAPADEMTVGDKSVSLGEFYTRLGRKMISLLTTRTFSGPLYDIDLRLRPNGKSGLLVTSVSAFASYQKTQAWTWEHQALIRARFIAGCDQIDSAFNRIRAEVLSKEREIDTLKKDIIDMREKMRVALLKSQAGCFDLKHGHGGIVDIEFIVQFGVLAKACRYEALLTYTDNIRLLLELNNIGFLSDSQQQQLSEAYKTYREASHHAALAEKPTMIDASLLDLHVKRVSSIWSGIFK